MLCPAVLEKSPRGLELENTFLILRRKNKWGGQKWAKQGNFPKNSDLKINTVNLIKNLKLIYV